MKQTSALVCVLLVIATLATAEEWPRFRGPNGAGIGEAPHVPTQWTEQDFLWRISLPGVGHSSTVVWNRRLFITSGNEEDGTRYVQCLDADTGRTHWTREFAGEKARKHQHNSFASTTPAVDARHVYITWSTPKESIVLALDHEGQQRWRIDLGPFKSGHGAGVSPIVHDGLLVLGNDQEGESSIVALECGTGAVRWRVPRKTKVAYSTPCVFQRPGGAAELIFTNWEHGIMGVDPQSGRTNWELQVFDQAHIETSIGSPIVSDGLVLGTCGWLGYATHTVAVRPELQQPAKAIEVYRVDRGAPLTTTPLAVAGLLFLWADEGIVTCVDAVTGKQQWRTRVGGNFYSSPVAVGDRIFCPSRDGEMIVLAADKEYRLLARNPLGEGSHSTSAIAHGRMYVRTFSHLIALGQ